MQLATILGHATSTVKHPSLHGWRLLVAQPLDLKGGPDGTPIVVIDDLGASRGSRVILTSDGASVSEMMGTKTTPVRWAVIGLVDE